VTAGRSPLETALAHRDNPYSGWAETERLVANLHRAYFEVSPEAVDAGRLAIPFVWSDMEAFHGGRIVSHA